MKMTSFSKETLFDLANLVSKDFSTEKPEHLFSSHVFLDFVKNKLADTELATAYEMIAFVGIFSNAHQLSYMITPFFELSPHKIRIFITDAVLANLKDELTLDDIEGIRKSLSTLVIPNTFNANLNFENSGRAYNLCIKSLQEWNALQTATF